MVIKIGKGEKDKHLENEAEDLKLKKKEKFFPP